jgi:hypothetical protein
MRTDRPVFIYSMTPRGRTAYRQFFEPGDLKKIIEQPGQIRPAGWDLTTRDRARIVSGEYLEVASAERKRIQVYEDGSVLVRVSGDEDFLSWGQNTNNFDQAPRLNGPAQHRAGQPASAPQEDGLRFGRLSYVPSFPRSHPTNEQRTKSAH